MDGTKIIDAPDTLYERDLALWFAGQAEALRAGDVPALDLPHLLEEIEGLAGRDRKELQSRILRIIEHMLKLELSERADPVNGWRSTIRTQRLEIHLLLEQSPSLRRHLPEMLETGYRLSKAEVIGSFEDHEPNRLDLVRARLAEPLRYTIEEILGDDA